MDRKHIIFLMIEDYVKYCGGGLKDPASLTCSKETFEQNILPLDLDVVCNTLTNRVMDNIQIDIDVSMVSFSYIAKVVDDTFNKYCEEIGLI